MDKNVQQTLFDSDRADQNLVILYALGDFQDRGFELAGRKLPLDRLLGAFKRAIDKYNSEDLNDEALVSVLKNLGATIEEVPGFVAKHPYRVMVSESLAKKSLEIFKQEEFEDL